jgi:hypothetical protein
MAEWARRNGRMFRADVPHETPDRQTGEDPLVHSFQTTIEGAR